MIDTNYTYKGKRAVLKHYKYAKTEAKMLEYLQNFINVPKVLFSDEEKLIIEYIPNNTIFDEVAFARELASLHQNSSVYFGLEFDTTIGPLYQSNKQTTSWIEFFQKERIWYMAQKAYEEKQLDTTLFKQIEQFCLKLEQLLDKDVIPSLLHGDIWSGNLLSYNNKNYLIDPAIYYGDKEMELAFIMMFNTFGERFFKSYDEVLEIDKEFFSYRYKIYQLYPYLVHVRIYGSSYVSGVREIVKEFV